MKDNVRDFLAQAVFDPQEVEHYLDPDYAPMWARYDPELGYVLRDIMMKDGLDDCYTLAHYESGGQRRMLQFADQVCRMNTYGDSFTQCHQVSDGETWQEYLSAHLGEPIRNFGIGGYGVYQAYRRARRIESGTLGSEYIILNIFYDGHVRSIDSSRRVRTFPMGTHVKDEIMFHATPWAHVRYNLEAGQWTECPSLCPTPASLRALCDPIQMYETFKNDQVIRLCVLMQGGRVRELGDLQVLAEVLELDVDLANVDHAQNDATILHMAYALRSTEYVLDLVQEWIAAEGKKLLVLLSYGYAKVRAAVTGKPRFDQSLIDYLDHNKILYVDSMQSHVDDYQSFCITLQQYIDRFYVGHYNPMGNHFFAFAVKNAIVNWLTPKLIAYKPGGRVMAEDIARLA